MKKFLDTSVLVAAFWAGHRDHPASIRLLGAASRKRPACSMHTLAEVFAVMTALPVKPMLPPEQVMLFVPEVRDRLTLVSLDESECIEAIQQGATAGFNALAPQRLEAQPVRIDEHIASLRSQSGNRASGLPVPHQNGPHPLCHHFLFP